MYTIACTAFRHAAASLAIQLGAMPCLVQGQGIGRTVTPPDKVDDGKQVLLRSVWPVGNSRTATLTHLFDGGMQQAQFLLTGRPVHKGLLCDEAVHTGQKAVHSLYVVGAPDLQTASSRN